MRNIYYPNDKEKNQIFFLYERKIDQFCCEFINEIISFKQK